MEKVVILYGIPPTNLKELWDFGFDIPPLIPRFMRGLVDSETVLFSGFQTLGAIALASYLKLNGIEVEAQDFFCDEVVISKARIVGISSTFLNLKEITQIVRYIKENNPEATIVLGGPISWSYPPSKIIEEIPEIDFIVLREGEKSFLDLIEKIQMDKSFGQVSGIAYKSGNEVKETLSSKFMNAEEIPFPDWNLVDFGIRIPILPIETARGCIYQCAFCSETNYWSKPVRFKPVDRVIEEIKINLQEFKVNSFRFVDSCFTAPEKRCSQICDSIIEENLDITWTSYARINNMSGNLLEKMKKSGCVAIDIGLESGDSTILRKMEKKYTPPDIERAIRTAEELDIITHCNLVVGFPGETTGTINNTINVLESSRPSTYDAYLLDVAPHTSIYDQSEFFGIRGNRMAWQHETMDTRQAMMEIRRIYSNVSWSHPFLGGEYFVGALTTFGYSSKQIRNFFSTFHDLYKNPNADSTPEFETISQDIKKFMVPWQGK
jgi:radical SAM superfamily enzyme YgiQ (UPF0313 family)